MRGSVHAVTAPCVFDGVAVHGDAAVVIDGARSPLVMPRAELPAIIPLRQFGEDTWLAPGFIEPVGDARASFALNGETVTVRDGRRARADGRLAGACLAMASAVRNCVRLLSVPLTTALRFASTHPAEFLGLGDRLGKLATGYRADMVALDGAAIAVLDTWVAGAGGER